LNHHGQRHRLVLYTFILDRWWNYSLGIGIVLLVIAAGLAYLPVRFQQYHILWVSEKNLRAVVGAGGYAVMLSFFLIAIRKLAYIRPSSSHLILVTPFLRLNISYRRIRKTSSVEMQHLFPIERYKGWKQKLLRPLANQTAIELDLQGWPIPRWILGLFLCPFFFPEKSTSLALLVPKWMDFSTDLESYRSVWLDSLRQPSSTPQSDILASISKNNR
jgi:hypothetical protein